LLPGGEIKPGETPKQAMCRELMEETRLGCNSIRHLFDTEDEQVKHSVFVLNTAKQPEKNMEINYIGYYTPGKGTNLKLGEHVRKILKMAEARKVNLSKVNPYPPGSASKPFRRLSRYLMAIDRETTDKYHKGRGR
jgi:ADP-ribose pyrophosphatase YjhB (NUDIX family)